MRTVSKIHVFEAIFLLSTLMSLGQQKLDFQKIRNEGTISRSDHSRIYTTPAATMFNIKQSVGETWDIEYTHRAIKHGSTGSDMDSIKIAKTSFKLSQKSDFQPKVESPQSSTLDPIISGGFQTNFADGSSPPDNTMAISDNGYVVSATNSNLSFADLNGNILYQNSLSNFFSVLGLSGFYFDPKVIYDPSENKFILVVLSGTTSSNSTVVIGFSTTENPQDPWWFYTLSGNPLGNGTWFDFPSIGVSTDELYISGNLFFNETSDQTLFYQIDKGNGFTGGNINWLTWSGIRDAYNNLDFTVVPISFGFDGSIGPGIFFISSDPSGGSEVMLYWTTGTIDQSPTLNVNAIGVSSYSPSGNGLQFGTSDQMATNDTRILSGFYSDETVHFVMNTDFTSGYTGIYYGRVDVPSLSATSSTFGLQNFDYAFPSVAPFATSSTDKSALIGFLRTGTDIYPQHRVVTCDNNYNWSSSMLVRAGDSYVSAQGQGVARWGDYSGISRRHTSSAIEVWTAGCFGDDINNGYFNVLSTWISKITGSSAQQSPAADFAASQTTVVEGQQVAYTDLSTNSPSVWSWSFPGGTPNTSTLQNPAITYHTQGVYDVTLFASNNVGNDTETKFGYVTVNSSVQAPIANFTSSQTVINENQQVLFTDLSTNNPTSWVWSFPGGNPNSSTLQNPTITYTVAGTYDVTLVASNAGGNNSETKPGYIIVNSQSPGVDFTAHNANIKPGDIVEFTDLTSNNPTAWNWSFPGGLPSSSVLQNPIIVYSDAGVYNVTLQASNQFGSNQITKSNYIFVDLATALEDNNPSKFLEVYPNPAAKGEKMNIQLNLNSTEELDFYVVDNLGRIVKHLLRNRFLKGGNVISFNTRNLQAGTYYILVQNVDKKAISSERFIVN